jgi:hypothetical protein
MRPRGRGPTLALVLLHTLKGGNEPMARSGDILGLGDAGLPSSNPSSNTDDITSRESSWSDNSEEAKRRRRMNEGADELTPSRSGSEHQGGHGAAGIDMGAGGEGTDIE